MVYVFNDIFCSEVIVLGLYMLITYKCIRVQFKQTVNPSIK